MSTQDFPRVLFLTAAAFNKTTGGGVTFTNLFSGWPKDRIATAHNDPVPTTTQVCDRYYRLGEDEIHRRGLWRHVLPSIAPAPISSTSSSKPSGASSFRRKLRSTREALFGKRMSDTGVLTPSLEQWVSDFRPQLLYTILGTNGMMELTQALCRRFNLPLAIHMMDDWPEVAYCSGWLSGPARRRKERLLGELFGVATARMCISDAMAEAYRQRYGVSFEVFQNAVDTRRWDALINKSKMPRSPARIVYIGSILEEAQLDSVTDCCQAVAALRSRGVDVEFHIHSPPFQTAPYRSSLEINDGIHLHDAVTDDADLFERLGAADILLLPVNFDDDAVTYVRYSMPTKVPAYLLSSTPILVYAPDMIAQTDYARRAGWGAVVGRRDVNALGDTIKRLLNDAAWRAQLSQAARATAIAHHDMTKVRSGFQSLLSRAAAACADGEAFKRGEVAWN
ncbi:MAG TPA: glycosyltransferase [Burkholderiales bacterium]|nr:glycosyltransferase [Burkholderiales bacterium]